MFFFNFYFFKSFVFSSIFYLSFDGKNQNKKIKPRTLKNYTIVKHFSFFYGVDGPPCYAPYTSPSNTKRTIN